MALSSCNSQNRIRKSTSYKLTSFMEQELKFVFGIFWQKKSNPKRNPENSPQISQYSC
jgi:hypothetical protein